MEETQRKRMLKVAIAIVVTQQHFIIISVLVNSFCSFYLLHPEIFMEISR